jgi:predicted DNA-binding ribbon-helix-helix protein
LLLSLGCTSIRLEMSFWDTLEEIAAKEEMSLPKFLTTLHNEVLDHLSDLSLQKCSRGPGLSWQRRGHSRRGRIDLGPM